MRHYTEKARSSRERNIKEKNRKEKLDFKKIHARCVVDNKNNRKSSQKQKLFIPVLIQQHVSASQAIIRLTWNIRGL
jgi:hypothetical protein